MPEKTKCSKSGTRKRINERSRRELGKKVRKEGEKETQAVMKGPKLISSHFNYNDTDNNIIRVWYPTMREIPLPPLSYDQWVVAVRLRSGTDSRHQRGENAIN